MAPSSGSLFNILVFGVALLGPVIYHFNREQTNRPRLREARPVKRKDSLSATCLPFRSAEQWLGIEQRSDDIARSFENVKPGPWPQITVQDIVQYTDQERTNSAKTEARKWLKKKSVIERIWPCVQPCLLKTSNKLPRLALVTAVRGGDAYVRRLLEQLTGVATGSVYGAKSHLKKEGFLGEGLTDGSVIVTSTHAHNTSSAVWRKLACGDVDGVLLIVRNPFDSVRAEFHSCSRANLQKGNNTSPRCKGKHWEELVVDAADRWLSTMLVWSRCTKPKLILHYDDLYSHHLEAQLKRISSFLRLELREERVRCVLNRAQDLVRFRPMSAYQEFTKAHVRLIQLAIDRLSNALPQLQERYSVPSLCPDCSI